MREKLLKYNFENNRQILRGENLFLLAKYNSAKIAKR